MIDFSPNPTLTAIADEVRGCIRCPLHQGRTNAVPGAGRADADILFIGEGPGFHEDKQGLPFVGQSGKYLEKLLASIGLTRADVFIANVVKCRPPENRDPAPAEIDACRDYLDRQIAAIDPLVIVTLGRYSMARYFPNGKITQIHGKPRIDGTRAIQPLYHPAAVLRNPGLEPLMEADFQQIPVLLAQVQALRAQPPGDTPPPPPPADEPPTQLSLF